MSVLESCEHSDAIVVIENGYKCPVCEQEKEIEELNDKIKDLENERDELKEKLEESEV